MVGDTISYNLHPKKREKAKTETNHSHDSHYLSTIPKSYACSILHICYCNKFHAKLLIRQCKRVLILPKLIADSVNVDHSVLDIACVHIHCVYTQEYAHHVYLYMSLQKVP
jgi:hypothetical protein